MRRLLVVTLFLMAVMSAARNVASRGAQTPTRAPASEVKVYLPIIAHQTDLKIDQLEISQSIQTPAYSVPWVADRRAVVRVYLSSLGAVPISGVHVALKAARGGSLLPGSPLMTGPVTVSLAPRQSDYRSTVNFTLPNTWLTGTVVLTATADISGTVVETDETNNGRSIALTFNPVPKLRLMIVPINYTHAPTGKVFPAVITDTISNFTLRTYPLSAIDVSFRTPIDFSGDLSVGSEWTRLLNYVTSIKAADGAPGYQVYYGLIPTRNANGDSYLRAWGGYAWYGRRAAIGVDEASLLGAHEIGHTFGQRHAPCGNPADIDGDYPYPNASIGHYGLDVFTGRLWSPSAPDYAKDFMSYCGPQWLSDYTYRALYDDQRARGGPLAGVSEIEGLFVRATSEGDTFVLQPAYDLRGIPEGTQSASDYVIELLDAGGGIIASHPVTVVEAEEPGLGTRSIFALVPRPDRLAVRLRLTHFGAVVDERMFQSSRTISSGPLQIEQLPEALMLSWGSPGVPALVRYKSGGDVLWTTAGVDVLAGSLKLDVATLPNGPVQFEVVLADTMPGTSHTLLFSVDTARSHSSQRPSQHPHPIPAHD